MDKKLEYLKWQPKWISNLGCIKGCLDYLKLDVSDGWLYGATGHAFAFNLSKSA
jgi:hypothetical protein